MIVAIHTFYDGNTSFFEGTFSEAAKEAIKQYNPDGFEWLETQNGIRHNSPASAMVWLSDDPEAFYNIALENLVSDETTYWYKGETRSDVKAQISEIYE